MSISRQYFGEWAFDSKRSDNLENFFVACCVPWIYRVALRACSKHNLVLASQGNGSIEMSRHFLLKDAEKKDSEENWVRENWPALKVNGAFQDVLTFDGTLSQVRVIWEGEDNGNLLELQLKLESNPGNTLVETYFLLDNMMTLRRRVSVGAVTTNFYYTRKVAA
eukprot:TRINITY_DN3699_c0_g1_i3.p1 TRINITY_DN3699_c0_g1~~TRINITY_DN3699_c0_g1_i3.p1  ORF type:complete len:183 (+),score=65.55 TRINITY_DN3699_c0_g1_i3:56-550(+)